LEKDAGPNSLVKFLAPQKPLRKQVIAQKGGDLAVVAMLGEHLSQFP
jgi:hypothetical protein